jgi:hypothetical protein
LPPSHAPRPRTSIAAAARKPISRMCASPSP